MQLSQRSPTRRAVVAGLATVLCVAMSGCGGGKGSVTGTVTLDGEPVSSGSISFVPASGPAVAGVIRDGAYSVRDVPTGEVKVVVQTPALKGQANQPKSASSAGPEIPKITGVDTSKLPPEAIAEMERRNQAAANKAPAGKPVPDKYGDPSTSGLALVVKSGPNKYDVPLTSK